MAKKRRGKLWVAVMLFMMIALPIISVFFLEKGFTMRREAPASGRLLQTHLEKIPDYFSVSQRGDTITRERMLNKVYILDFVAYDCGKNNDNKTQQLFEIQEDYYGKTKAFRIISPTIHPKSDQTEQLEWMAERYSAREIWHFVNTEDTITPAIFTWCTKKITPESDLSCPKLVYLVDGEGNLRGAYDPLDPAQFQDLYNDVLYLINKLNVHEQKS